MGSMISMLARGIEDPGAAKNYVEMKMVFGDGMFPNLPFRSAAVTFYREGGMSPHDRAEAAIAEAGKLMGDAVLAVSNAEAREALANQARDQALAELRDLRLRLGARAVVSDFVAEFRR